MCAIEEYARIRFTLFCNSASRLPANMEATAMIENTKNTGAKLCVTRLMEVAQQQSEHAAF